MKGKEGVMVMVDGRPTQLIAPDLANMLRNMNANQLDQVEIMTNPPAKYVQPEVPVKNRNELVQSNKIST